MTFPTEIDLLFQVSSFVEQADESKDPVALAYAFTSKYNSWQTLKQGFEKPPCISQNMEAALISLTCPLTLSTIFEDDDLDEVPEDAACGFIVAITNYNQSPRRSLLETPQEETVVAKLRSQDVLPLVCFEAWVRHDDVISLDLMNGFSRILKSFFLER